MLKNLGGHATLATPPFRNKFNGHVQTLPGNMRVRFEARSFNRCVAIIVFNGQKFSGHACLAMPPFSKNFKGSREDCNWKHVKLEVRSFNHFGAISI